MNVSSDVGSRTQRSAKIAPRSPKTLEKPYTFSDAKWDYVAEKKIDPNDRTRSATRNNWLLVERVDRGLISQLGKEKRLVDITRRDAIAYRDQLLCEGKAPRTVKKHIELASAVFQVAIVVQELNKANPFRALPVHDNVLMRDKRLPLLPEEIRLLLEQRHRMNADLASILTLLVHTGARLGEISGLAVEDFNVGSGNGPAFIQIRPNNIRRLKTKSSIRQVPLTEEALRTVQVALGRLTKPSTEDMPMFPRYGRNGGSDAASAALMKILRWAGINNKRKVIHSIRHSMACCRFGGQ